MISSTRRLRRRRAEKGEVDVRHRKLTCVNLAPDEGRARSRVKKARVHNKEHVSSGTVMVDTDLDLLCGELTDR